MRIIVFFDLPSIEPKEKREYRKFVKFLMNEGFIRMQESVFCKLVLNYQSAELAIEKIRKNKTTGGVIQCLTITEKQYAGIEYISGSKTSKILDTIERITEI